MSVEKRNMEIVKLLLSKKEIDINAKSILNNIVTYHSKRIIFITFQQ